MKAKIVNGKSESIKSHGKTNLIIINPLNYPTLCIVFKKADGSIETKRVGSQNVFPIDGFYDIHFQSVKNIIIEYELN